MEDHSAPVTSYVKAEIDELKRRVFLVPPTDMAQMGAAPFHVMVEEAQSLRRYWGNRGYKVSYLRSSIVMPPSGSHDKGAGGRPISE